MDECKPLGTGTVEVKIWVDSEDADGQAANKAEWTVGKYVRVYGHLRSFQVRGIELRTR